MGGVRQRITPKAQHLNHQNISLCPFKKVSFFVKSLYICSFTTSQKTFNLALRQSVKRLAGLQIYYVMCSSIFEELCFTSNSKRRRKLKARTSLLSRANPSQKWNAGFRGRAQLLDSTTPSLIQHLVACA